MAALGPLLGSLRQLGQGKLPRSLMYSARFLPLLLLLLGESDKSHRKRIRSIDTSPRGSGGPCLPGEKSGEPRSPQILWQPGQNASSRRELSIGASHELSFGECWKNHGKRITPIGTSPRGSGGPCLPGAKSGEPKRPGILRRSGQNASSRRELSIGAPHARDTPSRSRGTFDARLTRA